MFRADLFRTTTFRLTLGLVVVIIVGMGLQLALLYGEMDAYEQLRSSDYLRYSAEILARETPHELEVKLRERSTNELRVFLNGAALFDLHHHYIAGDIMSWPSGLTLSPDVQPLKRTLPDGTVSEARFLVVEILGPKGGADRLLVLERSRHMASELRYIARRAAMLSLFPLVVFALLAGIFLSHRALLQVRKMRQAIEQIMQGDLHERLPAGRRRDELERLADLINHMLDRLEQVMGEVRDVSNNIAHDLRTPLARVQARLERLAATLPKEDTARFESIMVQSQRDLEQCFAIITALLRIGEIESGLRRAGFARMMLGPLVREIVDLYEPIAEAAGIRLYIMEEAERSLLGDRDLLAEVLANLLDNAIKFTKRGGWIVVRTGQLADGAVWLDVRDTGTGIAVEERKAVLGRFYRTDKSRHVPGNGLGLSLVAAIVRLHEATLEIGENPSHVSPSGTMFRIVFPSLAARDAVEGVEAKRQAGHL